MHPGGDTNGVNGINLYRPNGLADILMEDIPEWSETFHMSRMQANWNIGVVCMTSDEVVDGETKEGHAYLDQRRMKCDPGDPPMTIEDVKGL